MKITFAALILALLFGCGKNRNQIMTDLINEKKALKDSMHIVNEKVKDYTDRALEVSERTHDTKLFTPLFDSASKCLELIGIMEPKLKAVEFSIDSLSKMK